MYFSSQNKGPNLLRHIGGGVVVAVGLEGVSVPGRDLLLRLLRLVEGGRLHVQLPGEECAGVQGAPLQQVPDHMPGVENRGNNAVET